MGQPSHQTTGLNQGSGVRSANAVCSGHSEGVRSEVLVKSGRSSWERQHLSYGLKAQGHLHWQREGRLC